MAVGFTDLEKAYDTISKEKWQWRHWGECGFQRRRSGEFKVNVGLKQGNALSPLLFIAVVELMSRKIGMKDILRKLL